MMKPSRTRDERKNPTVYTPEAELRHQLEQQASQKRKQKLYDALKEKQEILDHYANFKLPTGEGDSELSNFLQQKQQELDVLTKQLESQDPEYANPTKAPDTREIKRKDVFNPVFYDNFFQKNDVSSNQARIVSQGELDREKRLKLREEERMRRLAGIKESAYDDKPYLAQPLPEIKQSSKNANDNFQMPPYMKQQTAQPVISSDQYYSNNPQNPESNRRGYDRFESLPPITPKTESEKAAIKEALFGNKPNQYDIQDTEEKENTPMNRVQQLKREVQENRVKESIEIPERQQETMGSRGGTRGATPKNDNIDAGAGGLFNKLGGGGNQGGNLTDAEKKKKYKEELDALVQQKKGNNMRDFERMASREEGERAAPVRQSSAGGNGGNVRNLPPVIGGGNYGPGVDKQALEREEKKKYAEELRQEIAAKEREKERQKQERRVGSAMAANRRNVPEYAQQYQSEQIEPRSIQEMDMRRDENRRQSSIGGGGSIQQYQQQQQQANESEMDKKKKYREFLDAQVQEKKRIQSAKQGGRGENPLPPTGNIQRNNFHQQQDQQEYERYEQQRYEQSYEDNRGAPVYERKGGETPSSTPTPKSDNAVVGGGGFFLHKAEDEEKKRAEMRNLQKQKMAEELKKQMEEKEEQKRREKQRKTEEDIRERERLEREADEEKRKIEDEAQKKLQQEKRNREIAAGPPSGEQQQQAEPQYIKSTIPEPQEEAQYNRLQNIPEQDYHDIPDNAPVRDDSDLSRRRREDLGEHHPYLSKQDFYRSGNEAPGHRVAFDPNLFPQGQGQQYYPNMPSGPSYGSYGSVGTGPGMMPPPMNMGYPPMQPMHMGYMASGMDAGFGGYGAGANMYQEMAGYQNLMQQVMDERLKIERIAMEEQMLLEQYHNKIKEMKMERIQYEKECERIRLMLAGQIPVTSSVFMNKLSDKDKQMEKQLNALNNSYVPTLMNLKNIKASYVSNYNKLLEKSQQSLMVPRGFGQNPLQGGGGNQQNLQKEFQEQMSMGDTFKTQSAIEESGMFRQSLPANSDFNNMISRGQMDQSYLKDLEAYNAMNPQNRGGENNYLRPHDNPMFSQHQLQTNASNFSATLPQATEFRPIEGSGLHNIDVIDEGFEMRATPDVQENRMKQRNMETTPQVIYDDKSPFQTHQKQRQDEQMSGLKETTDFDSQLKQGLPVDSNLSAFKMSPKMSRRNVDESASMNRGAGAEYLSFNRNAIPVVQESERKQEKSEQEFLDAFEKHDEIIKPREEALEIKVGGEGRSQKSLVLAEDTMDYKQQEEYDDFLQSHDNAIEELRLGLWKSGEKPIRDIIREDDEDKRGTGFRNQQYDRDGVSPRQIGSAMSTGGQGGDKKYRGPKTIDPFAKVMKSEIRTSREKQPEESMFNYKETEEDRVKEKSYNEVSKISGFIMESAKKAYEFEPVMMKEEPVVKGYAVEEEEDNEAYDDEEERIPEKIHDKESGDEEIEEEYELEFEDYEDMGNTMKSNKMRGTRGNLKGTGENFKKISPEKNKKVSFEQSSEEKAPRVQTADLEALVLGKGNPRNEPASATEEGKDDKRSKTILNRLQRLLDDWEEDKDEEQVRIKEIGAKMEEFEKNKKDKDLFKPVGFGGNKGHSNRYSREGGI